MRLTFSFSIHCLGEVFRCYSLPRTALEMRAAKNGCRSTWCDQRNSLTNLFFVFKDSSSDPVGKANKNLSLPQVTLFWGRKEFFFFFCLWGKARKCFSFCSTKREYKFEKDVRFCMGTCTQAHLSGRLFPSIALSYSAFYKFTVLLTCDTQLSKQQLPHLPPQEMSSEKLKGQTETSITHTHCSTHLVLHAKLC